MNWIRWAGTQRFAAPLAPHLGRACRRAAGGRRGNLLRGGLDYWLRPQRRVLVEGPRGAPWRRSPDVDYNADLAAEFGFPLVVVAQNLLGVINQNLADANHGGELRADGLPIAGIVLNDVRPQMLPMTRAWPANLAKSSGVAVRAAGIGRGRGEGDIDRRVDWEGSRVKSGETSVREPQ